MPTEYLWSSNLAAFPCVRMAGFHLAYHRLKEAVTEIKRVARVDPLTEGGGVTLAERIWPAFQDIDTSSGALGGAMYWPPDLCRSELDNDKVGRRLHRSVPAR